MPTGARPGCCPPVAKLRDIDARGAILLPGLINAHAHVNAEGNSATSAHDQLAAQIVRQARFNGMGAD